MHVGTYVAYDDVSGMPFREWRFGNQVAEALNEVVMPSGTKVGGDGSIGR